MVPSGGAEYAEEAGEVGEVGGGEPWDSKTDEFSPRVASSTTARPDAVIVARTTRRSFATGADDVALLLQAVDDRVTEVGCTWSSEPIRVIGIAPAEEQQPQNLVPGEGQVERPQHRLDPLEQQLLDPDDRVTIAIPSAADDQPCATHWRCASRIGSRSVGTRECSSAPRYDYSIVRLGHAQSDLVE